MQIQNGGKNFTGAKIERLITKKYPEKYN